MSWARFYFGTKAKPRAWIWWLLKTFDGGLLLGFITMPASSMHLPEFAIAFFLSQAIQLALLIRAIIALKQEPLLVAQEKVKILFEVCSN